MKVPSIRGNSKSVYLCIARLILSKIDKIFHFLKNYPFLVFWGVIFAVIQRNYLPSFFLELPFGTHDWAQADRCSIALAYYHNGLDFWNPATMNLASEGGRVTVEFPLIAYLSAVVGRLTNNVHVIYPVFRLLNFSILVGGMFLMYKTIWQYTRSIVLALVGALFPIISVNTIFYAYNFLSDTAALGWMLIAFYFFVRLFSKTDNKMLMGLVFALTIGILSKMSTVTYAGAMCGVLSWYFIREKRYPYLLVLVIPFILYFAQYLWIQHRAAEVQSYIFLTKVLPISLNDDFDFIIQSFRIHLLEHYIPLSQIALWVAMVFPALIFPSHHVLSNALLDRRGYFCVLVLWMLIGGILMFYLFGVQFHIHDYYFISIYLPFFSICFVYGVIQYGQIQWMDMHSRRYVYLGIGLFTLISYSYVEHKMLKKLQEFNSSPYLVHFRGRECLLWRPNYEKSNYKRYC